MLDVEYKERLGASAGKRIAFTECTTFSELFSEWKAFKPYVGRADRYPNQNGVRDYCSTHSTELDDSLFVNARPSLVDWICANMIRSDDDAWSFDLVQRKDGILVVVRNEQIIASRWLALLDRDQTISEINKGMSS